VIRAVVFDVGEVIVNETREYGTWADWLGVPRHTFSAVFGAVIAAGRDYREVFGEFRPGFDLSAERDARAAAGRPESFDEDDLYPDAVPCMSQLRAAGLVVGVAGNQTARAESILRGLGLPADWIGTSAGWGVEKPAPEFFQRAVSETAVDAPEVLYVGDRLDNDIRPALRSGLQAALLRRGPWGRLLSDPETEQRCLGVMSGLADLPGLVAEHNRLAQAARLVSSISRSCPARFAGSVS
jgi:FMN phosphatase YigB (HAD superfamily)